MDTAEPQDLIVDDRLRGVFRVNRRVFTDPEILEAERREVFDRSWLYAGHESEIADPGDFVTRKVGGRPLILVRNSDGTAHAFLNTCPHRGNIVCRERTGSTRCRAMTPTRRPSTARRWPQAGAAARNLSRHDVCQLRPGDRGSGRLSRQCPRVSRPDARIRRRGGRDRTRLASLQHEGKLEAVGRKQHGRLSRHPDPPALFQPVSGRYRHGHGELGRSQPHPRCWARAWRRPRDDREPRAGLADHRLGESRARRDPRPARRARRPRARPSHRRLQPQPVHLPQSDPDLVLAHDPHLLSARPDYMEIDAWANLPRGESPELRQRRFENFISFLGPAGFGTPDNVYALEGCQRGFAAWRELSWSDISRGMGREQPSSQDELQMRAFWRRWHALMQGIRGPTDCSDRLEQRAAAE